jgi:hypothetical protein
MPGEKTEQPGGKMNKTGLFIVISCGVLFLQLMFASGYSKTIRTAKNKTV